MTDLTNRTVEEVNGLIQKYNQLLEVSGVKTVIDAQILVIIIDIAVNHIEEKYKTLNKDWKAWTVVVLKNLQKKISNVDDVRKIIDEFVGYYALEYQKYVDDLVWHNEYDRDWGFVHRFIYKKIGR
jgi:hypothetical protein